MPKLETLPVGRFCLLQMPATPFPLTFFDLLVKVKTRVRGWGCDKIRTAQWWCTQGCHNELMGLGTRGGTSWSQHNVGGRQCPWLIGSLPPPPPGKGHQWKLTKLLLDSAAIINIVINPTQSRPPPQHSSVSQPHKPCSSQVTSHWPHKPITNSISWTVLAPQVTTTPSSKCPRFSS